MTKEPVLNRGSIIILHRKIAAPLINMLTVHGADPGDESTYEEALRKMSLQKRLKANIYIEVLEKLSECDVLPESKFQNIVKTALKNQIERVRQVQKREAEDVLATAVALDDVYIKEFLPYFNAVAGTQAEMPPPGSSVKFSDN